MEVMMLQANSWEANTSTAHLALHKCVLITSLMERECWVWQWEHESGVNAVEIRGYEDSPCIQPEKSVKADLRRLT